MKFKSSPEIDPSRSTNKVKNQVKEAYQNLLMKKNQKSNLKGKEEDQLGRQKKGQKNDKRMILGQINQGTQKDHRVILSQKAQKPRRRNQKDWIRLQRKEKL